MKTVHVCETGMKAKKVEELLQSLAKLDKLRLWLT